MFISEVFKRWFGKNKWKKKLEREWKRVWTGEKTEAKKILFLMVIIALVIYRQI